MLILKQFAFLFLIFALTSPVFAEQEGSFQPKILLVTSLDLTSVKPVLFQESYRTYHLHLEKQFRDFFKGKNYRLEATHYIRQHDLWNALRSPENTAVILIAHSGSAETPGTGIRQAALVDLYGYDMTPVLQWLHPQMKFFGVVGCNYKKTLDDLIPKQLISPNPELSTLFFDKTVEASKSLEKTMIALDQKLKTHLSTPPQDQAAQMTSTNSIEVVVHRNIPINENEVYHPPVRIESAQGLVLGVLPPAFAGDQQTISVQMPMDNRKLVVTAGNNPFAIRKEISLGEFEFGATTLNGIWSVFSDSTGNAIGTVSHVYRFKEK